MGPTARAVEASGTTQHTTAEHLKPLLTMYDVFFRPTASKTTNKNKRWAYSTNTRGSKLTTYICINKNNNNTTILKKPIMRW